MPDWIKSQYETGTWISLVTIVGIAIVVLVVGVGDGWAMVDLDSGAATDIATTFILLVFVALVVERSTEALVAAWRPLGRGRLQRRIEDLKAAGAPEAEVRAATDTFERYRNRTRALTVAFGLVAGVFVAMVGVRMLEGIVASDALLAPGATLEPGQTQAVFDTLKSQSDWFRRLDILLTGLVIAGGSQGIHKMAKVFDNVMAKGAGENQPPAQPPAQP